MSRFGNFEKAVNPHIPLVACKVVPPQQLPRKQCLYRTRGIRLPDGSHPAIGVTTVMPVSVLTFDTFQQRTAGTGEGGGAIPKS